MNKDVLLFTNSLFNGNSDAIVRHKNYQMRLSILSKNRSNLNISKNIFSLCQKHTVINRCDCYGVISIPDPFLSYFESLLIRVFKLKRPKLQIQCHGDFGDNDWQKLNLTHLVFARLALRAMKEADQIRCMGKKQAEKIISTYKIDPSKIVIAPIPTKDKEALPLWHKPTTPVVAFLGRLHKERSVDLWAETAKVIFQINKNVHFLIIGDGPERVNFEKRLLEIPKTQITFSGKLPNEEAMKLLSNSSVLLSTALFESFGMAMVEAAKIGLPIVSKPTSGAIDLNAAYNSISLGDTPREMAELTLAALNKEEPGIILDSIFLRSESESAGAIVDAWLNLI